MAIPFECDYALQHADLVESNMCIVVIVNEFVTHVSNTADAKKKTYTTRAQTLATILMETKIMFKNTQRSTVSTIREQRCKDCFVLHMH